MEQFSYEPPDPWNLFTVTAILFGVVAVADFTVAYLLVRRQGVASRPARWLRAGSWLSMMFACLLAVASLVYTEPISHLREWAETEQVQLSDANANNLLNGRAVTKEGNTYTLLQSAAGEWTLEVQPAPCSSDRC